MYPFRAARPACLFLVLALCARAASVSDPAALDANSFISWTQLGAPGSVVPSSFNVQTSSELSVSGLFFSGDSGTAAKVCPSAGCNFAGAPGFQPGDSLLWAEDASGNGAGSLQLTFATPIQGAGFYLQTGAPSVFTANLFAGSGVTFVDHPQTSDAAGDPVFLGFLDPTADVTTLVIDVGSCTPLSPGGCNFLDYAIDSVDVAAPVPEPRTFFLPLAALALVLMLRSKRLLRVGLFGAILLAAAPRYLWAQSAMPYRPGDAIFVDGTAAVANLAAGQAPLAAAAPQAPAVLALPIWHYNLTSPIDGFSYQGYMVGQNPFSHGARTTTIPVILIPVIAIFQNTTSGFTTTFDPSSSPDAGCTAGETAMDLIEQSPIFQPRPWNLNNTDTGLAQYVDAVQRANFWQYVQNTGDAYHTVLSYSLGNPLSVSVDYASPTLSAEVRVGVPGPCTNPAQSGATNGAGYEGFVNISTIDSAVRQYIVSQGITPDQLPVFILYNVVMPDLNNPGFYTGGYHRTLAGYPAVLTSPGQTYAVADFQTNFFYNKPILDVSLLTHEIAEWMNDPGGRNATPPWGHIGQVSACQAALEVGDPLTGTNLPEIAGPNGFAYHVQELTFFSWFFRTPSIGAGGAFSSNGTFTSDAGPVCQ